jgi:hypothetical protein
MRRRLPQTLYLRLRLRRVLRPPLLPSAVELDGSFFGLGSMVRRRLTLRGFIGGKRGVQELIPRLEIRQHLTHFRSWRELLKSDTACPIWASVL